MGNRPGEPTQRTWQQEGHQERQRMRDEAVVEKFECVTIHGVQADVGDHRTTHAAVTTVGTGTNADGPLIVRSRMWMAIHTLYYLVGPV